MLSCKKSTRTNSRLSRPRLRFSDVCRIEFVVKFTCGSRDERAESWQTDKLHTANIRKPPHAYYNLFVFKNNMHFRCLWAPSVLVCYVFLYLVALTQLMRLCFSSRIPRLPSNLSSFCKEASNKIVISCPRLLLIIVQAQTVMRACIKSKSDTDFQGIES